MSIGLPKTLEKATARLPSNLDLQVTHYQQLLEKQAEQSVPAQESISAYIDEAQKPLHVGHRILTPFVPFRTRYSALRTITPGQTVVLLLLILGIVVGIYYNGIGFVIGLLALVMIFYLLEMLFSCFLVLRGLQATTGEQIHDELVHALKEVKWPSYTILCPLYHEAAVVPQLIQAMQGLEYPAEKLQILILLQDDDLETLNALQDENLPSYFQIVIVPEGAPRTKPRACNYGLLHATGEYVVIYDAEDIPEPLQLKKAILTFLNHGTKVVCVQAKLNIYNPYQNFITRWFTTDYSLWFDMILPGLQSIGLPIPLGGTSNHFRRTALCEVGGWDAFNVAEDCDLGLRLAPYGYKTVMLDSTTYEEANSHILNWVRQRSRWIKGYMQTYLVNMRSPRRYLRPQLWPQFIVLQFMIGTKLVVPLFNPLLWAMLWIYIFFRPYVEPLYHTLFPAPIFYIGVLSLIFGNFLSIYSNILVCLRLHRYSFIKWVFVSPLFWLMMSVAAYIALFELIFRPHYWRKTKHGLHLQNQPIEDTIALADGHIQPAASLTLAPIYIDYKKADENTPAISPEAKNTYLSSLATSFQVLPQRVTSVFKYVNNEIALRTRLNAKQVQTLLPPQDNLLWLLLLISSITGLAAIYYFFSQHQILSDVDAYSHLLIARRIIDNATPGLAQLGSNWLPLPHLLLLPFTLNDYLLHSGLAGACISFPCYLLSCIYIYLAARRMTQNRTVSFISTLFFALNPNILYLQSTPLTESLLIMLTTMACYHFLAWTQDDTPLHLILAALGTFLATLTRYDGWFLFLCMFGGLVLICLLRRQRWAETEGKILAFATLGGLGILLWLLWNAIIFGDPLYFQHGYYSAQADQIFFIQQQRLPTYHNLWKSIVTFTEASTRNIGLLTSILALFGLVALLLRHRLQTRHIGAVIFVAPFFFYVVSLYFGQASIFVDQEIFNVRYGAESIAPAAFFTALFASYLCKHLPSPHYRKRLTRIVSLLISSPLRFWNTIPRKTKQMLVCGALLVAIVGQSAMISIKGPVTVQEGISGGNCNPPSSIEVFMAQHYDGGRVLLDFYSSRHAGIDFTNIPYQNLIYEGSGILWQEALRKPASMAEWVIANPQALDDLVTKYVDVASPAFLTQYIALAQEVNGTILFHRKTDQALPMNSYDSSFIDTNQRCNQDVLHNPRPLKSPRPGFETGVVYPQQGESSYSSKDVAWQNGLRSIRTQTGAQWLDIPFSFSQASVTSTDVRSNALTPTLAAFTSGIQAAHIQGYHIFAVPLIYAAPFDTTTGADHWSGHIHFTTESAMELWFNSYWKALEPYVEVAQREGVEQLSIGTELDWLASQAPAELWETLISRVASMYSGLIIYNMNWTSTTVEPPSWLHDPQLNEIGVSTYFPLEEDPQYLTAKELYTLWGENAQRPLDTLAEEVQKPLVLSELGFNNRNDTGYETWDETVQGTPDPEEQALACDAAMQHIITDKHIVGVFFWGWDSVGTFGLRNMPAAATIHTWFSKL